LLDRKQHWGTVAGSPRASYQLICRDDKKLAAMITDRGIVIREIAEDRDPGTNTVGELADRKAGTDRG